VKTESLYVQATEAYRIGDYDKALTACETLLELNPAAKVLPAVLNLRALCLAGKGLMFAALGCLEHAIGTKPDDPLLRHHAARILLELGQARVARKAAEKACELAPRHIGYRYHLARAFLLEGLSQKAEQVALQCVQEEPAALEAWNLLSELAAQRGDANQAATCLNEILKQDSRHARALASLAALLPIGEFDPSVQRGLEEILANTTDDADAASAAFALADISRRRGEHGKAFAYCRAANDRLAAARPFAMDQWEQMVASTISAPDARAENAQSVIAKKPAERLIFIVGMPRSGTSLCEQIVSAHSGVFGGGERATMEHIEKTLSHAGAFPRDTATEPSWMGSMRAAYLESLPTGSGSAAWATDKTPRNFERLGLIFRLFPTARVLWCVRHPLDTILSCYFQDFGSGQHFSNRLDHCARMYIGHVRLMRHWLRRYGDSVHIVEYSGLVQELEPSVRGVADFLDLEFEPSMLEPHRNSRMVWTASAQQVKQPVYATSLDVWQHYARELLPARTLLEHHGLIDEKGRSTVLDSQ